MFGLIMINKEVKGIIMFGHQYKCLVCNPPTLPLPTANKLYQ